MILNDVTISTFYGLNTKIKDTKTLKKGVSPDSKNWITHSDHIELRRGYARLGDTNVDGNGKVTGLGIGIKYDGTEIPFYSHGRKLKYYDTTTSDNIEIGTNTLPVGADGDDVWIEPYQALAGSFVYLGSVNSSIYKIPVANPASAVDQSVNNMRFGVFHIGQNRAFAGQRNGVDIGSQDATGLYLSFIDKDELSDFSFIANEIEGSGDDTTKTFSGTLDSISGKKTLMYPLIGAAIQAGTSISGITKATAAVITSTGHGLSVDDHIVILGVSGMTEINGVLASVISVENVNTLTVNIDSGTFSSWTSGGSIYKTERFKDDRDGNLVSNLGGTGTVNYGTGAWSTTFNTAPITLSNGIISNYYYEDSTNEGILDFNSGFANGQAKNLRQDDGGGNLQAIFNINTIEYCFHLLKTWQFTATLDDTNSTNLPYRNVGLPFHRSAFQVPDGIIFADLSRSNEPKFRKMQVQTGTDITTIEPKSISDALDLSGHAFDYCVAFRWGDYEIFCVQEKLNEVANEFNTVMYIRNVISGAWDRLDYYASCLAEYGGSLLGGDSISNNVYTLFSGFDDDGELIPNYWLSSDLNLDTDHLKNCRRMVFSGLIQRDQDIEISLSYDGADFVKVQTIEGDGDYVSTGQKVSIGSTTIGSKVIGGGGSTEASPFEIDFPINSDRFIDVQVKIEAIGIGFVQVNEFTFKDPRDKGIKNLPTRTT